MSNHISRISGSFLEPIQPLFAYLTGGLAQRDRSIILTCPPAAAVTRLLLTVLVTTIIIIVPTRTMTPEGAAASERLIACLIPNYLGM